MSANRIRWMVTSGAIVLAALAALLLISLRDRGDAVAVDDSAAPEPDHHGAGRAPAELDRAPAHFARPALQDAAAVSSTRQAAAPAGPRSSEAPSTEQRAPEPQSSENATPAREARQRQIALYQQQLEQLRRRIPALRQTLERLRREGAPPAALQSIQNRLQQLTEAEPRMTRHLQQLQAPPAN